MKFIVIDPLDIESHGGDYVRRCNINRMDDGIQLNQRELWFQFSKSIPPPDDKDCDSFLLAILMDAMAEGRDLIVKGSVSQGLLSNLIEYQSAWNKWRPEIYSIIDIKVDVIRESERPISGAICAFSGGVDSMFSVWRNSQGKNSYRSQNIKLCVLVHGFDIPLEDTASFSNVIARSNVTVGDIGIRLMQIKTNYREISCENWEDTHASALVATLANFKNVAGTCVIGSTHPYNSLIIPWGSSPVIDFLLSSDNFIVLHDGSSHTRTEKIKVISEWKVGVQNLRVCWEGNLRDRNCGKCEKCVRTKLNFLANGIQIPSCFDQSDVTIDVKSVVITKEGIHNGWKEIVDYANLNGIKGAWVVAAKKVIMRKTMLDFVLPKGSSRRLVVKNIAKKLNIL